MTSNKELCCQIWRFSLSVHWCVCVCVYSVSPVVQVCWGSVACPRPQTRTLSSAPDWLVKIRARRRGRPSDRRAPAPSASGPAASWREHRSSAWRARQRRRPAGGSGGGRGTPPGHFKILHIHWEDFSVFIGAKPVLETEEALWSQCDRTTGCFIKFKPEFFWHYQRKC